MSMMKNQLILVASFVLLVLSQQQQAATAFVVGPISSTCTTRTPPKNNSNNLALFSGDNQATVPPKMKGNKKDVNDNTHNKQQPAALKNDMSMFLAEGKDKKDNGFDALEFFITNDESIQRLEEVEKFFGGGEPQGIMMEEQQDGVVPLFGYGYGRSDQDYQVHNNNNNNNKNNDEEDAITSSYMAGDGRMRPATLVPESNGGIMMTDDENARTSKKVMYYNYDGTLSKIKRNLYDNPVECYTD